MKIFLKLTIALVLLIAVAAISITLLFDPNDYKEDIISLAKEKTGRTLKIPGDINLSLFPWVGIDLGAIELSNAKGFGKKPFAKMKHLQVRAKLLPLLSQKLEADTIVIEGLTLNLAKNKQGISNWQDLTNKKQKSSARKSGKKAGNQQTKKKAEDEKPRGKNILAALALNGLVVKDAQFNWQDKQNRKNMTVKNIQLSIDRLEAGTKIPFSTEFEITDKALNGRVSLDTQLLFTPDFNVVSFYNTNLSSELKLASIKQALSPVLSSPLIQLNLAQQTLKAKTLSLSENDLRLDAELAVNQLSSKPYIKTKVVLNNVNPTELAKRYSVSLPEMAEKNSLQRLSSEIQLSGTLDNLYFSKIKIKLDDSTLTGKATIKAQPKMSSLNLVIDDLSIDRYLPAVKTIPTSKKDSGTKAGATGTKTPSSKQAEAVLIPVALLSAFNVNSRFTIQKVLFHNTQWNDFKFVVHSKNGITQVKPLSITGYGTNVLSQFTITRDKNSALISGKLEADKLQLGKLLNDYVGKDKLRGQTSITANFTSRGVKLSQLKKNLDGKLKLKLKDGTLKGFDLSHQLNVLDAKVNKKQVPAAPVPAETKIASLSASAVIKKGVLINKDLKAASAVAKAIGQGQVDIAREKIDYTATVKLAKPDQFHLPFNKIPAFPLDIDIRGTFNNFSVKPNFAKAVQNALKNALTKEVKKQEKKIKDKIKKDIQKELQKKLGNDLKNLFKPK